jgi:hypothetical protein
VKAATADRERPKSRSLSVCPSVTERWNNGLKLHWQEVWPYLRTNTNLKKGSGIWKASKPQSANASGMAAIITLAAIYQAAQKELRMGSRSGPRARWLEERCSSTACR